MNKLEPRNYIKGRKVSVCIRLPEELKKVLKQLAEDRGHDFSDFLREGLDQWAKAHEGK